jgi:hypothetical protein
MSITEAAPERRTARAAAVEFLQAALATGPRAATEVGLMALECGVPAKALRSAREGLKVGIVRRGFGRGSQVLWSLPQGIDALPQGCDAPIDLTPVPPTEETPSPSAEQCYGCTEPGGEVFWFDCPFDNDVSVVMHKICAQAWFRWMAAMSEHHRGRIVGRMKQRMKGKV